MDLTARLREDGEMVTERLDHWAAAAGDRQFFHYGEDGVTLTYADFARRTDSIAGNLAANGVAKGDRVSVYCANPLVSALVMFGTWKAGALYCPVNFAFTGRLLAYQLADTVPKLIVTEPRLLPGLNAVAASLSNKPAARRIRRAARSARLPARAGRLGAAGNFLGRADGRCGRPAGRRRLR